MREDGSCITLSATRSRDAAWTLVALFAALLAAGCCGAKGGGGGRNKRTGKGGKGAVGGAAQGGATSGSTSAALDPSDDPAAWAAVRDALTIDRNCFVHDARFCPRDPALVDPVIAQVLTKHFKGVMPEGRKAERVARRAGYAYREAWKGGPLREHVEQLIRQHYDTPRVQTVGTAVLVDLGHVPGRLQYPRLGKSRRLKFTSELLERDRLKGTEVGRLLAKHVPAHPRAETIELRAIVLKHTSREGLAYRYLRGAAAQRLGASEALVVISGGSRFGGRFLPLQPGDIARLASGERTLQRKDLETCPRRERELCRWKRWR